MTRPDPERGDAMFGAFLFAAALAVRVVTGLRWAAEPVWDGHYYDFGARRIAEGFGYSDDRVVAGQVIWHPWCHYPVGYSAFLAAFYRVFGAGPSIAALANSLVGAALAVVTWALARYAMSARRARAAGLIVALHPGLVLYAALVMSEPLAALLTLTGFWLAVRDARPSSGIVKGSLVLGLGALVRPQALLCAPFLAFVPPVDPNASGARAVARRLQTAALACAVALVPVLPWTLRNCHVMDGCALVSTNTGWNLAIGAFPRATGRFETLRSSDGCRDVTGQVQQDRCWTRYAVGQIAARPLHWLSLVPAKLGYTFDHESFAIEYLHEATPEAWPEARRAAGRDATSFVHRVLLAAAALGGIALVKRPPRAASDATERRALLRAGAMQGSLFAGAAVLASLAFVGDTPVFWPLAVWAALVPWLPVPGRPETAPALVLVLGLLATTLVTHAVFFGEDRYHIVVVPALAILAAGAMRPPAAFGAAGGLGGSLRRALPNA